MNRGRPGAEPQPQRPPDTKPHSSPVEERHAEGPHGQPHADQSHQSFSLSEHPETGGVPISKEKFDEILATEKGHRPPPESYLPQEYIAEHLSNFEDGASRILVRSSYEEYGIGKPDSGKSEFVLTSDDAKKMVAESAGDANKLAEKLGIPRDQLANDSLVVVEFHPTRPYEPHVPSGNEWGANDQWLPGGRLPKGDLEAIVHTEGMVNGRDYTVRDIVTGEIL